MLDMNHLWPNMGHDALVELVRETANYFLPFLTSAGIDIRVLSYEVRDRQMIPEGPSRFSLYIGTGGPGHLDPAMNDGVSPWSQGIRESPSWEAPLFELFDAIRDEPSASLLGVCHTFGVLCRWAGIATAAFRSPAKGGKSSGVHENVLTPDAVDHPWFRRFSRELPDGRRFRVIDNRLFDMIPASRFPAGIIPLAREVNPQGRGEGEALTMVEMARDRDGVMPRILASNHHPEVIDREHSLRILADKFRRGEVSSEWYEERARTLTEQFEGEDIETALRLTSQYTLLLPLQFQMARLIRLRREELGLGGNFHEDQLVRDFADAEEEVPV